MSILVYPIVVLMAFCAIAFAAWPVLAVHSGNKPARALLAGALGFFVIAIGAGVYLMEGRPALAVRAAEGTNTRDLNGVIALLARKMRERPNDVRGWTMLGRAYLTTNDDEDAAKAFARGIEASRARGMKSAELFSGYGEALVRASAGAVTKEAEAAFVMALAQDPKDMAARYYLGFAYASRGENAKALALWQGLLADTPLTAPYRQELVDRIAALTAASGTAPDVDAMVASLAARLKANPDDPQGWLRLVRAYVVLKQPGRAAMALKDARIALAAQPVALAALTAEAGNLRLK